MIGVFSGGPLEGEVIVNISEAGPYRTKLWPALPTLAFRKKPPYDVTVAPVDVEYETNGRECELKCYVKPHVHFRLKQ